MGQSTWNAEKSVTVPDRTGNVWTLAYDWLTPGKLYRIEVRPSDSSGEQKWTPQGASTPCTADGDTSGLSRRDQLMAPDARLGALIGKIGGSTADAIIKDPVQLFTVGRHCVFKAPEEAKTGALYLAINDTPSAAALLTSSLKVVISEAH